MTDQIEANQHLLATAIRSIGLANALQWLAVANLLDNKGVLPLDGFAELASKLADYLEMKSDDPDEARAGAAMLREVHDAIRRQNPQKFTPTVVKGGAS